MATRTDNRQKITDKYSIDTLANFPLVSSAGVGMCWSDDTSRYDLYLSYLQNMWRYCGENDWFQFLCPKHQLNVTRSALKFSKFQWYRGNCLWVPAANQMYLAGLNVDDLNDQYIEIVSWTGIWQRRKILDTSEPIVLEKWLATTASNSLITDTLKNWAINQYIWYQCRVISNTWVTQLRKILYNSNNTLYFYDANYQQLESWQNNPFCSVAPYAAPVAGVTGTASHFVIERNTITVDSNWTVTPDSTSSFVIQWWWVFNLGWFATTPFSNFEFYDVLSDCYTYKTPPLSILTAALWTDYNIEKLSDIKTYKSNITTTSFTGRTFTIPAQTPAFTNNQRKNYNVHITAGTWDWESRRIISNTATTITVDRDFPMTLDNTTVFDIKADFETIFMVGNTFSWLFKYDYNKDMRSASNFFDFGQARNGAIAYGWQEAFGITSWTYLASGITSLAATPVAKGTLYTIWDVLTIDAKWGKCRVETISQWWLVETVSLINAGTSTYTTGTKTVTGWTGTGCTVNVVSVGKVCKIIQATNTNLVKWDVFTISGISAAWYNGVSAVHAIETLTSFDILCPSASGNMTFSFTQSATVLVDSTKNRVIDEHKGRLICTQIAWYNGAAIWREILSNTATTITFATITTAPVNGLGRYFIADVKAFGKARQYLAYNQSEEWYATSGSATTLVDTSKNRDSDCWVWHKVRIVSGTGKWAIITITANWPTTLTAAARWFTADTTTEYQIMDTYGTVTWWASTTGLQDTTKKWKVNQFSGMRVRFTSGLWQNVEQVIVTNTVNTLVRATGTAPDTSTTYCILDSNSSTAVGRWLATEFVRDFNNNNGKYCYAFRWWNTNIVDRYNITTETFDIAFFNGYGQSELFTTGTQYVFDGKSRIYINPNATQRILYYDILKNKIYPFYQMPDTQWTALIGNRMEIISNELWDQFLCFNRQSTVNFYTILLPTY